MTRVARKTMAPIALMDPLLAALISMLLLVGLIMVASASVTVADREMGQPMFYFLRQTIFAGAGLAIGAILFAIPTRVWERTSFLALPGAFVLLILVLIPGVGSTVNGSTRWLNLGAFNVQASEPARLLLLIYLSGYLVRHQDRVRSSFRGFLTPMVFIGLATLLLLMEPDFGASTVLLCTALAVTFIGGVRLRDFLVVSVTASAIMIWLASSNAERVERLKIFLNPWADPYDSGFQLTQSLIAIGRGETFGVGLGASVQKLFYLPEAHTDFVFAVLSEELGLVGAVLTITLYLALVWRIVGVSRRAAENGLLFQSYVVFGFGVWIGLQAFINIGVNMGVLPTKGLTLPLISYGGSSLVVTLAALALVLRVDRETRLARAAQRRGGTVRE